MKERKKERKKERIHLKKERNSMEKTTKEKKKE